MATEIGQNFFLPRTRAFRVFEFTFPPRIDCVYQAYRIVRAVCYLSEELDVSGLHL